jgi:hypothetical protein
MTFTHMHDGEVLAYEENCPKCGPPVYFGGQYPPPEASSYEFDAVSAYPVELIEENKVIAVELHMTPETARKLCAALYRMQAYHVNQGLGIPASGRGRYPDLQPLFLLYDLLASKGYE